MFLILVAKNRRRADCWVILTDLTWHVEAPDWKAKFSAGSVDVLEVTEVGHLQHEFIDNPCTWNMINRLVVGFRPFPRPAKWFQVVVALPLASFLAVDRCQMTGSVKKAWCFWTQAPTRRRSLLLSTPFRTQKIMTKQGRWYQFRQLAKIKFTKVVKFVLWRLWHLHVLGL